MLNTRYILKMKAEVINTSVLRIGNGEETILLDTYTMRPILPASGVAGSFRNFLEFSEPGNPYLRALFGEKEDGRKSRLFIEDAVCKDEFDGILELRRRVSIDPYTGTGGEEKFQVEMLGRGKKFDICFTIEARDKKELDEFQKLLRKAVKALGMHIIRLGAQKTNGGGEFEVRKVWEGTADLFDPLEYGSYLADSIKLQDVTAEVQKTEIRSENIILQMKAVCRTPIMIGGDVTEGKNYAVKEFYKDSDQAYVLPGSSLKGVIKMHCYKIAEYIGVNFLLLDAMFGKKGSDGRQGSIFVSDSIVERKSEGVNRKHDTGKYHGIGINKFTGGVRDGANYHSSPIKETFDLTLSVQRLTGLERDAAVGLLLFVLRDLGQGRVAVGASSGKGFGRFDADKIELWDGENKTIRWDDAEGKESEQGIGKYMEALEIYRRGSAYEETKATI